MVEPAFGFKRLGFHRLVLSEANYTLTFINERMEITLSLLNSRVSIIHDTVSSLISVGQYSTVVNKLCSNGAAFHSSSETYTRVYLNWVLIARYQRRIGQNFTC